MAISSSLTYLELIRYVCILATMCFIHACDVYNIYYVLHEPHLNYEILKSWRFQDYVIEYQMNRVNVELRRN